MSNATVDAKHLAFRGFVEDVEPRLLRALVALRGREAGRDATAEALMWAWEHWSEVQSMVNPAGYLNRVGCSRSRVRRRQGLQVRPVPESAIFEPGLAPALLRLSPRQRTAVILVHGCGWTYDEVAEALNISRSSVGTHVTRGMARLREEIGAGADG